MKLSPLAVFAASLLSATASAQTYNFDLTVVQAVPGSPGPVPMTFDGTFTDRHGVISNIDIISVNNGWYGPNTPGLFDVYQQGGFGTDHVGYPASNNYISFTIAHPLNGKRDVITSADFIYNGWAFMDNTPLPVPFIPCGSVGIYGDSCSGSITRVRDRGRGKGPGGGSLRCNNGAHIFRLLPGGTDGEAAADHCAVAKNSRLIAVSSDARSVGRNLCGYLSQR
jgi:hypothetical protein